MTVRNTPWQQRLLPITRALQQMADRWAQAQTDEALAQLAKDAQKPTSANCYAHVYQARGLVAEAIRNEQAGRGNNQHPRLHLSDDSAQVVTLAPCRKVRLC